MFSTLQTKIIYDLPHIVVVLAGQLDLATGDELEQQIEELEMTGVQSLTFCLSELEFIDSSGIGQLIGYYRKLAKQNIQVNIENDNEEIEEIFELIGVREIIS